MRSVSALLDHFTYFPNNPTIATLSEQLDKSTLPLLIELDDVTDEHRQFLTQTTGCTDLSGQGIILATDAANVDPCDGHFLVIPFKSDLGEYHHITSQWSGALAELSSIIKFGTSLSTNSFGASCKQWLQSLLELQAAGRGPHLAYNALVQRAMLGACAELLGNVHGDWTHDDIHAYLTQAWPKPPAPRMGKRRAETPPANESGKSTKVRVARNGRKAEVSSSTDMTHQDEQIEAEVRLTVIFFSANLHSC